MFALAPTIYRRFCFCFHLFFQLLLFLPYSLCSKWKSKGSFQYVNRLMSDLCSIPQMAPYFFQNKYRVFTVVYKALLDLAHLSSVIFHLSPQSMGLQQTSLLLLPQGLCPFAWNGLSQTASRLNQPLNVGFYSNVIGLFLTNISEIAHNHSLPHFPFSFSFQHLTSHMVIYVLSASPQQNLRAGSTSLIHLFFLKILYNVPHILGVQ